MGLMDPVRTSSISIKLSSIFHGYFLSHLILFSKHRNMKNPGLISRCYSFYFLEGILLLFWLNSHSHSAKPAPNLVNETDQQALLEFKNRIAKDPHRVMDSWNESVHLCNWTGIECDPLNNRVASLKLEGLQLVGSLPPSIGNLTFLRRINLKNNSFHGEIPPQIGRLSRLQHLNLSYNSFEGELPSNLSHCTDLRVLTVSENQMNGQIPYQLSSLLNLEALGLGVNNFTGKIPAWIGNFSSLQYLVLQQCSYTGSIPEELGHLSSLGFIGLNDNQLSGTLPASLFNISSLFYMSVALNRLHGQLPPNVGLTLPNLQIFAGGANQFTGPIPASITNASGLQILDFAQNSLNGTIPPNVGYLSNLTRFNFDTNFLDNGELGDLGFLSSLVNCTYLSVLGLGRNRFRGQLPNSIGNLSKNLQIFTLGGNLFHGSIPAGFGNLVNLLILGFEVNSFSGKLPDDIGRLQGLQFLNLNTNKLSGPIPSFLANLSSLAKLSLEVNHFEGFIPPSLGNCPSLKELDLSYNNLTGTIPREIFGLTSLSTLLGMSHNSLIGSLPSEVGNLKNVGELDFSENKLSGEIPGSLGTCSRLERLHLEGNAFEGSIPTSLRSLRGLEELDVSRNNLSGMIPEFLSENPFQLLNLSWNNFEGEVPKEGIFANASIISIFGNDKLCGGIPALHLPACSKRGSRRTLTLAAKLVISAACAAILVIFMFICFLSYKAVSRRKISREPSSEEMQSNMSYSDLLKLTNGFSPENLIGSGSFGSVYKEDTSGNAPSIAVKVINLQQKGASKAFTSECNALRSIRHRNLLKIITACSTFDHQGNEFKALVFEFMENGNLDKWLHPGADEEYPNHKLSLIKRLNIAIDIASALEYLHHGCLTSIVHCDLKPSNVLLDEDMVAHVADFGLARFLFDPSNDHPFRSQTMSSQLKGSIGYIPPEYGMMEQVSTSGDAYSYGVLLLEMFTGKRPTDDMFKDDMSIRKYVEMEFPQHVMDVVDSRMVFEEEMSENDETRDDEKAMIRNKDPKMRTERAVEECLTEVLEVGLLCSITSPVDRITMTVAVNRLQAIRKRFFRSESSKRKGIK